MNGTPSSNARPKYGRKYQVLRQGQAQPQEAREDVQGGEAEDDRPRVEHRDLPDALDGRDRAER